MKDFVTFLIIVFVAAKVIDFGNMGALDYCLITLILIYLVVSIVARIKKTGRRRP